MLNRVIDLLPWDIIIQPIAVGVATVHPMLFVHQQLLTGIICVFHLINYCPPQVILGKSHFEEMVSHPR